MPLASGEVAPADPEREEMSRCSTGASLEGWGLNPIFSRRFPLVSVSCRSSYPVNFSPSVTNPSHALCGQPRHPAPSPESARYLHEVVQLLKMKYVVSFIASVTFIRRALFYNPSLWGPVIT